MVTTISTIELCNLHLPQFICYEFTQRSASAELGDEASFLCHGSSGEMVAIKNLPPTLTFFFIIIIIY